MVPFLTPGHIIKINIVIKLVLRLFLVVQCIENRSTISDYYALSEGNGCRFYIASRLHIIISIRLHNKITKRNI